MWQKEEPNAISTESGSNERDKNEQAHDRLSQWFFCWFRSNERIVGNSQTIAPVRCDAIENKLLIVLIGTMPPPSILYFFSSLYNVRAKQRWNDVNVKRIFYVLWKENRRRKTRYRKGSNTGHCEHWKLIVWVASRHKKFQQNKKWHVFWLHWTIFNVTHSRTISRFVLRISSCKDSLAKMLNSAHLVKIYAADSRNEFLSWKYRIVPPNIEFDDLIRAFVT